MGEIGAFRQAYDIRFHTEMLRRHLDLLAYPAEEHESRVTMISDLLKNKLTNYQLQVSMQLRI